MFSPSELSAICAAARTSADLHPICAWCWVEQAPGVPFPAEHTSTICERHRARELGKLANRRQEVRA